MNCPRCGTPMEGGICPECGFPVNRMRKKRTMKSKPDQQRTVPEHRY